MTPLLLDLPMELYLHALPALGRSSLAELLGNRHRSRHAGSGAATTAAGDADAAAADGPAPGSTPPGGPRPTERVRLGQRVHDAILLAAGRPDWRAVTGTEHAAAALAGEDEADEVRALLARDAFLRSPFGALLARGLPELTVAWHDARAGAWLKARPDLLDADTSTVWELKTVPRFDRAAATAFLAQPRNLLQSAMYRAAMREATGRAWGFAWLTVELDAPRRVVRHDLPLYLVRQGDWMMRDALARVRALPERPGPLDPDDWRRYALEPVRARRLCLGGHDGGTIED